MQGKKLPWTAAVEAHRTVGDDPVLRSPRAHKSKHNPPAPPDDSPLPMEKQASEDSEDDSGSANLKRESQERDNEAETAAPLSVQPEGYAGEDSESDPPLASFLPGAKISRQTRSSLIPSVTFFFSDETPPWNQNTTISFV